MNRTFDIYDKKNGNYVFRATIIHDHSYDEKTMNAAAEMGLVLARCWC